jgi:hypothetical protein
MEISLGEFLFSGSLGKGRPRAKHGERMKMMLDSVYSAQ